MGTIAIIVVVFVFIVAIVMIRDEYPADAFNEPPTESQEESHTESQERTQDDVDDAFREPPTESQEESQERTQDDVDAAVIEYLSPLFSVSSVGVEIGRCRQRDVDREKERLEHHRQWLKGQTDPMVVKAYVRFLDYFEHNITKAQAAIDTGARAKFEAESERRQKEWKDRQRRGRPIPRPDETKP